MTISRPEIPFRQVHLDFHTSEAITHVGSRFDAEVFATTLVKARVNSINCFARCHHGLIYFDTTRFPERRHPHLKRNLLKEQIDACHAHGIRVPIYVTVQWDHYSATQHPEWLSVTEEGSIANIQIPSVPATKPYEAGFHRALCVNSPYFDFLRQHVEEIFEMLPVDGFWFDIVTPLDDSSRWTRLEMLERGLNPADREQRQAYGYEVINRFKHDMTAFVRKFSPDCSIFYNEGHVGPHTRPSVEAYTQLDIESLPSGEWGYAHFPLTARYTRTLGKDWLGMNGKFHTMWGDFHAFKNEAALQFECFQMLAFGGKSCVGDQLHPDGEICQTTYELIGAVYEEIEKKEPWCTQAKAITEIGVLSPGEFSTERTPAAGVGVMRMLQEGGYQFDMLDTNSDLNQYKVLILPDRIPVSPEFGTRLQTYLKQGGAILASYNAGLNPHTQAFTLAEWGVRNDGLAPYSPDFIIPEGDLAAGLPRTEHVMYIQGRLVEALPGSERLADAIVPYFNRTWEHFCSHRHTPSSHESQYPAIVRRGNVIYFAHPVFTQYNDNAPRWVKRLVFNALSILLPKPLLVHNGPSTLIATLNEQPGAAYGGLTPRWVVHLLHYIPVRISQTMDTIDNIIPLHNVTITLQTPQSIKSAELVPNGTALTIVHSANAATFTVPVVMGHQMICLSF